MLLFLIARYPVMHNEMQQQQQQQQRSNGDGTLSPTSNQLARWFSPELLAQGTENNNIRVCLHLHNLHGRNGV